jgi:tetratricopeptide (TPR) repeat protein
LKLEPEDDVARRERGFTAFQMGRFEQGVGELRRFVARHPGDAVGHFELGAAEAKDDPEKAMAEFDRALRIEPDFAAAHSARGGLYYQMGKPEAALPDLEAASAARPDDAVSLDRLGQTYQALDRAPDAVRVLREAARLAPDDSKTQLHLARALADAGEMAESKAAMERFRQLGPVVAKTVPGGLVDYLSLTPEQRRADYRIRVERLARTKPGDAAAQVTYLRLLLEEGDAKQALETARRIAGLKPAAAVLADAGRALLEAGEYAGARDLLRQASRSTPAPDVQLDLAAASFRVSGAEEGMRLLNEIPQAARGGEYFLARAEMLDAMGQAAESAAALEQALRSTPARAELYRRACAFLMRRGREADALRASGDALRTFPQDRQILLLRIAVLEKAGRKDEAMHNMEQAEARWPEWPSIWIARGSLLAARGKSEEARRAFETAVALGASGAEVARYREQLAGGKEPDPMQWIGR